jgi:hypothetical protein
MSRSVSIIDYKVQQADFFLGKLEGCGFEFFAAQCYADAFVSACRSITFSIQAVCNEVPEFESWYLEEQNSMKANGLCVFFNNYRTASIHVGQTPVLAGTRKQGDSRFYFMPTQDILNVPELDVVSACRTYFKFVVDLVFRLYVRFPSDLDDRWHYTKRHFDSKGLSIEDALVSLGYPKGWAPSHSSEKELDDQWRVLRKTNTVGPVIQEIFHKYLNRGVEGPDKLDP